MFLCFQGNVGHYRRLTGKLVLEIVKKLSKKIYVGNLSYGTTETQVRELFEQHGTVQSIAWITDRDTGRFRGFAFVEMEESSANAAIRSLNSQMVDGRELKVNEAKPQSDNKRGYSNRNRGYNNRY